MPDDTNVTVYNHYAIWVLSNVYIYNRNREWSENVRALIVEDLGIETIDFFQLGRRFIEKWGNFYVNLIRLYSRG